MTKKFREMNGFERVAYRNVKGAFDWEVGGWYNCLMDEQEECIPNTMDEAKEIVYNCAMNDNYLFEGSVYYERSPKEMRFAGSEFVKELINQMFTKDPDVEEIAEAKGWC